MLSFLVPRIPMYKSALKALIITVIAFAGLSISTAAMAAGTSLHIEQKGGVGKWTLTYPNGAEQTDMAKTKILSAMGSGTYRLTVRPPEGTYTTIELFENNVSKQTGSVTGLTFDLKENTVYRATISYAERGTITVRSNPAGAAFSITDTTGGTYAGTTPATFTDMPTGLYRITYDLQPECEAKKTQERPLEAGQNLIFTTNIDCGTKRIATPGKTAETLANGPTPTATEVTAPAQRVVQTSSFSEVIAGSRVRITLSVRNVTKQSLRNVRVTDKFSPDMIDIVTPLNDGGVINGSQLEWTVPSIYAGQTWTTSFDILVKDIVQTGERIVLLAQANSGGNDDTQNPEAWSSVVTMGVAHMPQTGNMLDMILTVAAMLAAALITNLTIRRKAPVAFTA